MNKFTSGVFAKVETTNTKSTAEKALKVYTEKQYTVNAKADLKSRTVEYMRKTGWFSKRVKDTKVFDTLREAIAFRKKQGEFWARSIENSRLSSAKSTYLPEINMCKDVIRACDVSMDGAIYISQDHLRVIQVAKTS